jgi:hypothetical protein
MRNQKKESEKPMAKKMQAQIKPLKPAKIQELIHNRDSDSENSSVFLVSEVKKTPDKSPINTSYNFEDLFQTSDPEASPQDAPAVVDDNTPPVKRKKLEDEKPQKMQKKESTSTSGFEDVKFPDDGSSDRSGKAKNTWHPSTKPKEAASNLTNQKTENLEDQAPLRKPRKQASSKQTEKVDPKPEKEKLAKEEKKSGAKINKSSMFEKFCHSDSELEARTPKKDLKAKELNKPDLKVVDRKQTKTERALPTDNFNARSTKAPSKKDSSAEDLFSKTNLKLAKNSMYKKFLKDSSESESEFNAPTKHSGVKESSKPDPVITNKKQSKSEERAAIDKKTSKAPVRKDLSPEFEDSSKLQKLSEEDSDMEIQPKAPERKVRAPELKKPEPKIVDKREPAAEKKAPLAGRRTAKGYREESEHDTTPEEESMVEQPKTTTRSPEKDQRSKKFSSRKPRDQSPTEEKAENRKSKIFLPNVMQI